jgi:hypothetical protein
MVLLRIAGPPHREDPSPMEDEGESVKPFTDYKLGITWNVFGDLDRVDLDKWFDHHKTLGTLTPVDMSNLVSLWKNHPKKQGNTCTLPYKNLD